MSLTVPKIFNVIKLGFIAGIGMQGIANGYFKVDEGQEAIVDNDFLGYKHKVYSKGTHLIVPWIESPVIYDIWTRKRPIEDVVCTSEFQKVKVGMQVLMHPRDDIFHAVLEALGPNFEGYMNLYTKISLMEVAALTYTSGELFSEKESISKKIQQNLAARVAKYGMVIDNVSINSITVGEDFDEIELFLAGTNGAAECSPSARLLNKNPEKGVK